MTISSTLKPLSPVWLEGAGFSYAPAIRAGDWLVASGQLATDYESGISPQGYDPLQPLRGTSKQEAEASHIFSRLGGFLSASGADFSRIVRLDQYYTDWRTVPHYHRARHKAFAGTSGVPASTSILERELLYPDASLHVEMLAHVGDEAISVLRPDGLPVSPHMGFAPVVKVGEMLFLSGQMAEKGNDGIAPEARVPDTHHWKGSAIRLETDYILKNKLAPALEAAGAQLSDVVKAQAYLSDANDIPAFCDVWARWFPENPPALSVIPAANPGFNVIDASIEINVVALKSTDASRRAEIKLPSASPLFAHAPQAVRAGDFLFISALMAVDADGLVPGAKPDVRQPHLKDTVRGQMRHMLDQAEALCAKAGTSLANVVRIQQFHTDLGEFLPSVRVWQEKLGESHPLPLSAVGIPSPLVVKDATILLDLWVYVPPHNKGG